MKSIKEIIEEISINNGHFPMEQLQEIVARQEEAIPELLEITIDLRDNFQKYVKQPDFIAIIYAFFLLAQFKVKEFFPIFIDILRLPAKELDDVLGEFITEDAGRVLASTFDGNIQALKDLAEDQSVLVYARSKAIDALMNLVVNGQLSKEDVLAYYITLLKTSKDPEIITNIICASDSLYPIEIYEEIKLAYDKDLVDEWVIGIDDIEGTLKLSEDQVLARTKERYAKPINDIVEEMKGWACFYKDRKIKERKPMKPLKPKKLKNLLQGLNKKEAGETIINEVNIGRNEPCPCGSGKKYKKCCIDK